MQDSKSKKYSSYAKKLRRLYAQIKRFSPKPEICPVYGCGAYLAGAMHKQIHWKKTGHIKPVN